MKKFVFWVIFWFLLVSLHAQNYDKANPPTNITVNKSLMEYGIEVKWNAAENSSGYEVFSQMEGSKIIISLGRGSDGDMATDTYTFLYSFNRANLIFSRYPEKRWRFGVRSSGKIDSGGRTSGPSDIVWSSYINISSLVTLPY